MKTFDIHCELGYEVGGPSTFLLNVEAASMPGQRVLHESLVTDPPLACDRYTDPIVKNRFVRFNADTGSLRLNYRATVEVEGAPEGVPDAAEVPVGELPLDVLRFILPSRYCESDALMRMALLEFGALPQGAQRVEAICQWIRDHIKYEVGTTQGTHSAFDTVTGRAGVCRDFAHLAIASVPRDQHPRAVRHGLCDVRRSSPGFSRGVRGLSYGGLAPLRSDRTCPAVGPSADRDRARRGRRGFRDHLRARAHDLYVPAHRARRHAARGAADRRRRRRTARRVTRQDRKGVTTASSGAPPCAPRAFRARGGGAMSRA